MKIITANLKKGFVKLKVETQEDLWYLSNIIEAGDVVKGTTVRKIKTGTEEKSGSYKKTVFIAISTDEIEFSPTAGTLKVSGTITEGPEEISRGSHHTMQVEVDDIITIEKQKWLSFQVDKLKEASEAKGPAILLCVFDREEAYFAEMTRQGHKILSHIKGEVAKKRTEHKASGDFYKQVVEKLKEYDLRFKLDKIILASPSFWKEELLKTLGADDLRKKLILATCSSADETAFNEVLKREETKEALKQDRMSQELRIVDEILSELSRNGQVAYGVAQVGQAADAGAIRTLAISDKIIQSTREQKKYGVLEKIMKAVDSMKGKIMIIHSAFPSGKKLDGLGGIAALLRYKI